MSRTRPLFVHVIGLEGCGHHGLFPVLAQAVTETHGGDEYNRFFRNKPRNAFNGMYCRNYSKRDCIRGAHHFLGQIPPDSIMLEDNSYPSGNYRDVTNQWDIHEIYHTLKDHCDVRFAHLTRNVFNMVNSRREFDETLQAHAEKMAEIGRYIDAKMADIEAEGLTITRLNYDELESQTVEIGALIDCPSEAIEKAINEQFKKSTKNYRDLLTTDEIQGIKNAFGLA
ncbi:MAG: hypothetical protein GKS01_10770 [Alphaproteobacteria bacterium]|nr:hypothetical protein [Alphaproteobacteria bacterium]